jgi:zinc carboxypeptidase
MTPGRIRRLSLPAAATALCLFAAAAPAQQTVTETRDPKQQQDDAFAKAYAQWTSEPRYGSPLVDHLPKVAGIPSPKDVLGYYIGAPKTLTYYADILKFYRALAAATPRVQVETIGRSDEGRELVVVWVTSEENLKNLAHNRANLAKLADPRGLSDSEIRQLIETTRPHYHLIGGLHSGETGPPEMLMELVYRLATETSPLITQIRNNVFVSVTPAAEPDGRDRNIDWFYRGLELGTPPPPVTPDTTARAGGGGPGGGGPGGRGVTAVPYWGKYVYHDNNRDINLSQLSMRALTDWYYTAHPPIMHDLHEAQPLLYTYSGGPPQNPNLDPLLFAELPFFSNWELSQMTKWGMPGVYTHAFMDGWSPGYLGSVAYNHNGMMRMYETQSGRDVNLDSIRTATRTRRDSTRPDSAAVTRPVPAAPGGAAAPETPAGAPFVRRPAVPTGRGGGQPREWYRGIPIPPNAANAFTRRNNTNYMETGVLSALQLTSMFPNLVLENFYVKTRNAFEEGRTKAPYAYVFPLQRDMTRVVTLVNIFRAQGIEVGLLNNEYRAGADTLPAGSYLVKLDQPYGRLARNLLEKQDYPDPALTTYDDSGWSMGYAMNVEVREIKDRAILEAKVAPVGKAEWHGKLAGSGTAALAVAHLGSNNMISFRYRLKQLSMQVAEQSFSAENLGFPAGSFIVTGTPADLQTARAAADSLGLTAAALASLPVVKTHDADLPRVAIYSQWSGTQELGWYRHAFDQFGIPFDLIFKERVMKGNLKADYDVILMAAQTINRVAVLATPAAKPQPYQKSDKYKFLGMYGETPDMTGGFGAAGVTAFEQFLSGGGTLIATLGAVRFPIEFGFAHTVDTEAPTGVTAQKPLIQAEIKRTDHPVFYGYEKPVFPVKFGQGSQVFRVGIADQGNVLAQYKGGDASVLSGLMVGADNLKGRAFAVDLPNAFNGKGRVLLFANNPVYRWQNHGEFNLIFNSIINWNDLPAPQPAAPAVRASSPLDQPIR